MDILSRTFRAESVNLNEYISISLPFFLESLYSSSDADFNSIMLPMKVKETINKGSQAEQLILKNWRYPHEQTKA